MSEEIKVHYRQDRGLHITGVSIGGIEIPTQSIEIVGTANDPVYLILRIGSHRIELVEQLEEEIAEDSEIEQPEDDNF